MLNMLEALVDKSLLLQVEQAGEPRFMMLETIRDYGLEQLAASGESEMVRLAHARYYLMLAEETAPRLLSSLGLVYAHQGNYAAARACHEESLSLRREMESRWGIADSLRNLGRVAQAEGEYTQADELLQEGLALFGDLGAKKDAVECLESLAAVQGAQGQATRAARLYGAAERLRAALEVPRAPLFLSEYELGLIELRIGLGHEPHALKRGGLSLALPLRQRRSGIRDVRLHDGSPAEHTNVLSSDYVSVTSAATRRTTKNGLAWTISLVGMPARGAATRGVARIDQHDGNARPLRLVGNKGAQLKERPAMQDRALLPASPHPRANALQVLQGKRTLCAFGNRYQPFADRVVYIPRKAGLLS